MQKSSYFHKLHLF